MVIISVSDFKDNLDLYCNIFGMCCDLTWDLMFNVKILETKPVENHWGKVYINSLT